VIKGGHRRRTHPVEVSRPIASGDAISPETEPKRVLVALSFDRKVLQRGNA